MKKPRVFVVQNQHRLGSEGRLTPKFDLSPAAAYGELVYLLSPNASPFRSEKIITELHDTLVDYDGQRDYLLLVGNPCLIGIVCAVAAERGGGHLRMLQWDGRAGSYVCVEASVFLH
jgi:hypothetical protein